MHHTLLIDEILNAIFNVPVLREVAEDRNANHASSSVDRIFRRYPLLSLALTCRSFYEPATRVLWRRINGLDRLIGSMSHGVVQRINSPQFRVFQPIKKYMFLKKVPSKEDWTHLERLAAYVQEFDGIDDQKIAFRLGNGILQVLENRYSDRGIHIFPSLRVLSCGGCVQLHCVNFLLHPELHTLRITFFEGECDFCAPAFSEDERRLPVLNCLNHIHFSAASAPLLLYGPISKFLLAHATINLKSVRVEGMPVPSEVARAILQCEALEEIALKVTSFDTEDLFAIDMPRPNLRSFHMESERPAEGTEIGGRLKDGFYTTLTKKLRAPNLVAFEFSGPRLPYASDIKSLLETMLGHEHSDGNQARTIKLIPPHWPELTELPADPQPHICTFANALHALTLPLPSDSTCACPSGLEVLDLDEVYADLSDKELGILGASLPHLKSLTLSARACNTGQGKSRTTLIGLWLLAKHCQSLEDLGLLIDARIDWEAFRTLTGFDGDHDSIDARVEHYALARNVSVHNLYLGESTVGEESIAKEFLGMVFPVIWNLFYARSREETHDTAKWRAIKHSLSRLTSS